MAAYTEPQTDAVILFCANPSQEVYDPGPITATYMVINGTGAALSNVNAGGTDVSARSYKTGVSLTEAELAALTATQGVAVALSIADPERANLIFERVIASKKRST